MLEGLCLFISVLRLCDGGTATAEKGSNSDCQAWEVRIQGCNVGEKAQVCAARCQKAWETQQGQADVVQAVAEVVSVDWHILGGRALRKCRLLFFHRPAFLSLGSCQ